MSEPGGNFIAELEKALQTDADVVRVAEQRLREDPDYAGPERRSQHRDNDNEERHAHAETIGAKVERHAGRAVTVWGAVLAIGGGLVTAGLTYLDARYLNEAEAAEAQAKGDARDDVQDERIGKIEGRLDSIDRNGSRTLVLQLKGEERALKADIASLPPGSPGRSSLERQLDAVQTDLKAMGQ